MKFVWVMARGGGLLSGLAAHSGRSHECDPGVARGARRNDLMASGGLQASSPGCDLSPRAAEKSVSRVEAMEVTFQSARGLARVIWENVECPSGLKLSRVRTEEPCRSV